MKIDKLIVCSCGYHLFYFSGTERRRQGKFQPFRRLFGKKKKREVKGHLDAAQLKASFSTGEVCNGVVSEDEESNQNLRSVHKWIFVSVIRKLSCSSGFKMTAAL